MLECTNCCKVFIDFRMWRSTCQDPNHRREMLDESLSVQSSCLSQPLFLLRLLHLTFLLLGNLMVKLFIYFYLYLSSSSFSQVTKYLKTKPMKKLKHFPSLKLISCWLLLWSLCFCFALLSWKWWTEKSLCLSREERKE